MKTTGASFDNQKSSTEDKSEKQKQLVARKKIEDYIAEKKLRESIGEFDFGF